MTGFRQGPSPEDLGGRSRRLLLGSQPGAKPVHHHEESAAFMATAHAKSIGWLGVCRSTPGFGAIRLLNGLYDAKLDPAPVLALTGKHESIRSSRRRRSDVPAQTPFREGVAMAKLKYSLATTHFVQIIVAGLRLAAAGGKNCSTSMFRHVASDCQEERKRRSCDPLGSRPRRSEPRSSKSRTSHRLLASFTLRPEASCETRKLS